MPHRKQQGGYPTHAIAGARMDRQSQVRTSQPKRHVVHGRPSTMATNGFRRMQLFGNLGRTVKLHAEGVLPAHAKGRHQRDSTSPDQTARQGILRAGLPHPGVECFTSQVNKLLVHYGCKNRSGAAGLDGTPCCRTGDLNTTAPGILPQIQQMGDEDMAAFNMGESR
jgi:hypothetical protein